ncbi:hypothetical protein F5B20DRAFT_152088 [Whalleya microplaca]|nr:hypothetical protein F5B20DRAFT_152088 [Whalleya microplaca]
MTTLKHPILIDVNTGCRKYGDVRSPSNSWNLFTPKGTSSSLKVLLSRFSIDSYLRPSNQRFGRFDIPGGCFLEGDLL